MIESVCFDFFNTLVQYDPPREIVYSIVCKDFGIEVSPKALSESLPTADRLWRDENRRSPIDDRPQREQQAFWAGYVTTALNQAGKEVDPGTALRILQRLHTYDWNFKEFDDTIPTLKALKERNITIGLISNTAKDMEDVYCDLGLEPYLDFKVTSLEVGCDKPDPRIFNAALEKAECLPGEAIYVGDQYELDILGALGVGMGAVLIDRNNWYLGDKDIQRIESLSDILNYI